MNEPAPSSLCPVCGKSTAARYQPFCSSRCHLVDLGKWLGEGHRIETTEPADESSVREDE